MRKPGNSHSSCRRKKTFFTLCAMCKGAIFVLFLFSSSLILTSSSILVNNTLKEIDSVEGRIDLELIRVWNADDADDPEQFFKIPSAVVVNNDLLHVVDSGQHAIKVFNLSGKYIKTIGGKGQGPGDLLTPLSLDFDQQNNMLVAESDNNRVQIMSSDWTYISSFKIEHGYPSLVASWAGNEVAVYSPAMSAENKTVLALYNREGRFLRFLGVRPFVESSELKQPEELLIAIDKQAKVYFAYYATPFFQSISSKGEVLLSVTYEVPFPSDRVEMRQNSITLLSAGEKRSNVCSAIAVDDRNGDVFLVATTRPMNQNEIVWLVGDKEGNRRTVKSKDYPGSTDRFRLLVFNREGRVVAAKRLSVFCDSIYLYNERLFIIDSYREKKIYEYRYRLSPGTNN